MEQRDKSLFTDLANETSPMSTQIESSFDDSYFQQRLPALQHLALSEMQRNIRSFLFFHAVFAVLICVELILFLGLLSFFSHSVLFACFIGALFVSIFSYVALLFYFQAKKTDQFTAIKNRFLLNCRQEGAQPLSLAAALLVLSERVEKIYAATRMIRWFKNDSIRMRELFVRAALGEQLQQVRETPTDLEVHASLANTYLVFARLMQIRSEELFRKYIQLALEEFRIMNDYAPQDPWVHEQLAHGYGELGMVKEQIGEWETLLSLRPHDRDVMVHLGRLYFEHGCAARGLRIYEQLKRMNYKRAEELISCYIPLPSETS
jgi:hypothetical protein